MTVGDQMASAMAELIKRGAEGAVHHDMQVLQAFAHKLRGLGDTLDVDEAIALLPNLKVPEGFCHARYTVYEVTGTGPNGEKLLGEPRYVGSHIDSRLEQIELRDLVCSAAVFATTTQSTSMGPGRWIETFALPVANPGMIELALVLEPYEVNDGSDRARIQAELGWAKNFTARVLERRATARPAPERGHEADAAS